MQFKSYFDFFRAHTATTTNQAIQAKTTLKSSFGRFAKMTG